MHSPELLDHFQNPRNAGWLDHPDAVCVEVSNPACGDVLRLSALQTDGFLREVRYQSRGCTAAIAAGSALTGLMLGRSKAELGEITATAIEAALGGLAPASKHAATLSVDALRALIHKLR